MKRRHQPEFVQHLRQRLARVPDGARLHGGLVDHAEVPLGDGGSCSLAEARAEREGRMTVGSKLVRVVEAARLAAAGRTNPYTPSSRESFCDAVAKGRCAMRLDVRTMNWLMAFCAIASRSGMLKERI